MKQINQTNVDECVSVLTEALNIYDKKLTTARDAIDDATDVLQKRHLLPEINERFKKASLMTRFGRGENFHRAVIETMLGALSATALSAFKIPKVRQTATAVRLNQKQHNEKQTQPIVERKQATTQILTQAQKPLKPVIGLSYKLVAEMGLKDIGGSARCKYQFSRKRHDISLPIGTEIVFMGIEGVGPTLTKKLVFFIKAGTPAIVNNALNNLSTDLFCAGVLNHIDPNDQYNIALAKTQQKRNAKAELKKKLLKK